MTTSPRRALVTGGSGYIGSAICMQLAAAGMHVVLHANSNLARAEDFVAKGDALRAVFVADRTGKGMMDTAWEEALKGGTLFINSTVVTELLFNEGCCVGAVLFQVKEGEFVTVLARSTVLSTGGSGQVFQITTNCRNNTGDGPAVILRAGLPVMDPEAVQFHPTGIVGPGILASEALRSEGGILRNREMEPFMERYAPKMKDLAPRDIVARAIETEIQEGRGIMNPDHQIEHVWIDLRHLPAYVHEVKLKEVASFFKTYANLDSRTQLCPVRPSNHYPGDARCRARAIYRARAADCGARLRARRQALRRGQAESRLAALGARQRR